MLRKKGIHGFHKYTEYKTKGTNKNNKHKLKEGSERLIYRHRKVNKNTIKKKKDGIRAQETGKSPARSVRNYI